MLCYYFGFWLVPSDGLLFFLLAAVINLFRNCKSSLFLAPNTVEGYTELKFCRVSKLQHRKVVLKFIISVESENIQPLSFHKNCKELRRVLQICVKKKFC